jgi:hypothetical protein
VPKRKWYLEDGALFFGLAALHFSRVLFVLVLTRGCEVDVSSPLPIFLLLDLHRFSQFIFYRLANQATCN